MPNYDLEERPSEPRIKDVTLSREDADLCMLALALARGSLMLAKTVSIAFESNTTAQFMDRRGEEMRVLLLRLTAESVAEEKQTTGQTTQ